jgi:hypothetical protein
MAWEAVIVWELLHRRHLVHGRQVAAVPRSVLVVLDSEIAAVAAAVNEKSFWRY